VLTFPFPIWEFKHTVTWLEWLWTEFGLVNGFIKHIQTLTTSNYWAVANLQFSSVRHVLSLLSLLCLHQRKFPGSRLCRLAAISYQTLTLLAAISILLCNGSQSSLYSLGTNCFQQLPHCCVLTQPLPSNGCFSGSTVLALSNYARLLPP
jgi:hypothetical protein